MDSQLLSERHFFFMRHHMGTDVSNLLLVMNSENVNLSLQLATPLSQLIYNNLLWGISQ